MIKEMEQITDALTNGSTILEGMEYSELETILREITYVLANDEAGFEAFVKLVSEKHKIYTQLNGTLN